MDILQDLASPFPPAKVSWRVGSTTADKKKGLALAYIDARDVMARLDQVCGGAGWQDRYEFHGPRTVCYLSVKIDGEWVTKADGAGDSDVEAEKGAISDAFKRAAVKWGIGRYLYDVEGPWVELRAAGRSYAIADGEYAKLAKILPGSVAPRKAPAPAPAADAGTPFDDAEDRTVVETILFALKQAATRAELKAWGAKQAAEIETLPAAQQEDIRVAYAAHSKTLPKPLTLSEAA
ncbi:Rad52/Rad22 family DNA repair protein [Kaistia terrae]|uniref:Rad52/Rad22 family DNA repair protein n=1 Tax=Kaistia terrae TaxID=537017 RepID=A0ABW0Q264_9HYPH|nr:Rad52/Rad22 family DNA repair protein [Kaistia terrae]MCX5581463.1 Rad52/Rad22 family DNA repair protein [Kaistia terrae]